MRGYIQGIRCSCRDKFKTAWPVTIRYGIERRDPDYWLRLEGGPTGYESIRLFNLETIKAFMDGKSWEACFGTKHRWDRLIIPASEMLRIIEKAVGCFYYEILEAWTDWAFPSWLFNTQKHKEDLMAKETKDVAVIEDRDLVPSPEALKELQENLEGIEPVFPVIKIIHQGQMFEMPDGEMVRSFLGIIIDTNAANAYWKTSYDDSGGGDVPDCFSRDSLKPAPEVIEPMSDFCKKGRVLICPMNQFGSEPADPGEESQGKACKNMRRMHILVEGSILPYRLSLSPANIVPAEKYVTVLASQGLGCLHVATEFSLIKTKSKGGHEYSGIVFKKIKVFGNQAMVKQLKEMKAQLMGAMRDQIITPEEYDPNAGKGE